VVPPQAISSKKPSPDLQTTNQQNNNNTSQHTIPMNTHSFLFCSDAELQAAAGGGPTADITNTIAGFIPYAGKANDISGSLGGPTIGSAVESVGSTIKGWFS
jgi:hypothetical protein